MNLSEAIRVSPELRQYRKALSLLASLERRADYHRRDIQPLNQYRLDQLTASLTHTVALLDNYEFISHTQQSTLREPARKLLSWVFEGLPEPGPAVQSDFDRAVTETMTDVGRKARAAGHTFGLHCEVLDRTSQGWFLIFNTLTIRDGEFSAVFSEGATAFQTYIRRFDNLVARATHGTIREAHLHRRHGLPYHTYFACVEAGARRGRLHIHVLHFVQALPLRCRDPNKGRAQPTNRIFTSLYSLWPHGYSAPVMVRYSPSDAYGKAGYVWPIDPKTGVGLKTGDPARVGGYVAKYVSKSYLNQTRETYLWRVRKTRNLGRQLLLRFMETLNTTQLLVITGSRLSLRWNHLRIPPTELRMAAIRRLQILSSVPSSTPSPFDLRAAIKPQASLLQRLRAWTKTAEPYSPASSSFLETIGINATVISNSIPAIKRASEAYANTLQFRASTLNAQISNRDR